MECYSQPCTHTYDTIQKVGYPYPDWLTLPDTIVEHCKCGEHNRVWSMRTFLAVWRDRRDVH